LAFTQGPLLDIQELLMHIKMTKEVVKRDKELFAQA
jgi:hypothetical protein